MVSPAHRQDGCKRFIRGAQLTVRRHFATLVPPCTTTKSFKVVDIKKAIITAASKTQRTLPLQTLVDRDGTTKAALRILIEEILAAGIEEICVVISPGDEAAYTAAAGGQSGRLRFVEQAAALGYGHAVGCARE